MAAYVDKAAVASRGRRWHHLTADSIDELHVFAAAVGLRRSWFDRRAKYPHYDVTDAQRDTAISLGAVAVDARALLQAAKRLREIVVFAEP